MKKIDTQDSLEILFSKEEEVVVPSPSESTIDFLKMFARTYCSDKVLTDKLNYLCIN